MANNFMQISHNDRYYVINKDDSLKTLLTQEELSKASSECLEGTV